MKKSQLNAISRYYTWKNEQHALEEIERRGLTKEFKKSGRIATRFLQYYRTDEEKVAAAAKTKQKAKERRELLKKYGVDTMAEVREKQREERKAQAEKGLADGIYKVGEYGKILDVKTNEVIFYGYEL